MDNRRLRQSPNTNSLHFQARNPLEEVIRPLGGSVVKHNSNTYYAYSSPPILPLVIYSHGDTQIKGHTQALQNSWILWGLS